MTYARSILVLPSSPGTYHCVSRCVRRAWLCGDDRESGRSYEHRRQWVEDRIGELAETFAVAIWGFAVMSNHLHVVVEMIPEAERNWSAEEVADRWLRLYSRQDQDRSKRAEVLAGNDERIDILRARLCDLSWFMRCLAEPIARRANREDGCKGHFMSMDGRYAGFAGAKTGLGGKVQVPGSAGRERRFVGDDIRGSQPGQSQDLRQP
mgnify:CR=1 FL=1